MQEEFIYNKEIKDKMCDELIDKVKVLDTMLDDRNNELKISDDILEGFIDKVTKFKSGPGKHMIIGMEHYDDEDVIRYLELDNHGVNVTTRFADHGYLSDTCIHCNDPKRMIYQYAEITHSINDNSVVSIGVK